MLNCAGPAEAKLDWSDLQTLVYANSQMVENLFTQVGVRKSRVATKYVRVLILARSCS